MDIEDIFLGMFAVWFYNLTTFHFPKPDMKSPHIQMTWKRVVVESPEKGPCSTSRFRWDASK